MDIKIPILDQVVERLQALETKIADLHEKVSPTQSFMTAKQVEETFHICASTRKNKTREGLFVKYRIGGKIFYDRQQVENAIYKTA